MKRVLVGEKSSMTEIQKKLLSFLKVIDEICRENNIEYYLIGGTLIGALRHGGFIPWDDDADIMMTRENWNRFRECFEKKGSKEYILESMDIDPNFPTTVNHFGDDSTTLMYRFNTVYIPKNGLRIDIIILDPNNYGKDNEEYRKSLTRLAEMTTMPYTFSVRTGFRTPIRQYVNDIHTKRLLALFYKETDFDEKRCNIYTERWGTLPLNYPKRIFQSQRWVKFEDTILPVPSGAEDFLCIAYGYEWMIMPQNKIGTHDICVFNANHGNTNIVKDYLKRTDISRAEYYYLKKKEIQGQLLNQYRKEKDSFLVLQTGKIKCIYDRPQVCDELRNLLNERNYSDVKDKLKEWIAVQGRPEYVGSPSPSGWIKWVRKETPVLIDVNDDFLHIALRWLLIEGNLTLASQLIKARKEISRNITDELKTIFEEIEITIQTESLANAKNFGMAKKISDAIDACLNRRLYKKKLTINQELGVLSKEEYIDQINKGLMLFKNDEELLIYKADLLIDDGNDKWVAIYSMIAESTQNGLLLKHMREKLESISIECFREEIINILRRISIQYGETVCKEQSIITLDKQTNGNKLLKHRLDLLKDAVDLFKKNNIECIVAGNIISQLNKKTELDPNTEFSIMIPADKLPIAWKVLNNTNNKEYYAECLQNNPDFPGVFIRYSNINTIDFSLSQYGRFLSYGIHVDIVGYRSMSFNKIKDKRDSMLIKGMSGLTITKFKRGIKEVICVAVCSLLKSLLGRQKFANRIWGYFTDQIAYSTDRIRILLGGKSVDKCTIQTPLTITIDKYEIEVLNPDKKTRNCYLERNWNRVQFPSFSSRVIDTELSFTEYFEWIDKNSTAFNNIIKERVKILFKKARLLPYTKKCNYYWNSMLASGDRDAMQENYCTIKDELIEEYQNGNYDVLRERLEPYFVKLKWYASRGIGLFFDKDIWKISKQILLQEGLEKEVKKYEKLITKNDFI